MSAILEAARIQGSAKIERKAWAARGDIKFHLWELSTGGVILLKQMVGVGFDHPVKLEESLDVVVERFR
ncbi:MAG: hypothetical protein CMK71_12500 [Pseudomonadaceae bacterium]|nr:hypothetical protein [Pseudomonadaceae bacterium]